MASRLLTLMGRAMQRRTGSSMSLTRVSRRLPMMKQPFRHYAESRDADAPQDSSLARQITSNPAIMTALHKLIGKMEQHGLNEEAMPTEEQWESLMGTEDVQACLEELRTLCDEAGIDPGAHVIQAMAERGKASS